jgi:transposase
MQQNQPPILFTDESSVGMNMNSGGIWRYKGEVRKEGFYFQYPHAISIMVWGGIGMDGFKTPIIMCPQQVNRESYVSMLVDNQIPDLLGAHYGDNYLFQQDNASPHKAARDILSTKLRLLNWRPAKSPDLSPIETIWALVKQKLRGKMFTSRDDLFVGIECVWNSISADTIINFAQSFYLRLKVCVKYQGECLNGHWHEVHVIAKEGRLENDESEANNL